MCYWQIFSFYRNAKLVGKRTWSIGKLPRRCWDFREVSFSEVETRFAQDYSQMNQAIEHLVKQSA